MRKAASEGTAAQLGMPFQRANTRAITHSSNQPISRVARKPPDVFAIALILTSALLVTPARGQDPPANLAKLVAHRETETETERNEYTYRQGVTIDELDDRGGARGQYLSLIHISEPTRLGMISYAVFCLKKKKK